MSCWFIQKCKGYSIVWIKRQVVELCCFVFFQSCRWSRVIDWADFLSQNLRLESLLSCTGSINTALLWSCNFNVCLVQRLQLDQHQELALRSWDSETALVNWHGWILCHFMPLEVLTGQNKNRRVSVVGWDLQDSSHPTRGPAQDGLWSKWIEVNEISSHPPLLFLVFSLPQDAVDGTTLLYLYQVGGWYVWLNGLKVNSIVLKTKMR